MGKEDVVYISYLYNVAYMHIYIYFTIEYYSAIKKIMPFAATWMDLEIIILSEVRQRKTNI